MQTFEFEGKNAEEAIGHACRELNLSRDQMDIEVVEPGSAGIFGLVGGRKARIRVTIPEVEEESVIETEEAEPNLEQERAAEPVEMERLIAVSKEALENILSRIPIEATIHANEEDGRVTLRIEGDKSGLLIGRKGRTLDAIQYIVNKIVNRATESKLQVEVDSEDYRRRRKEVLVQMALKMGDKAKKTKKPVTTGPLNPHDRRIIHLSLKEDDELETKSRGDGILKKVLIIPKR